MADFTIKAHDQLPSIQATLSSAGAPVDLTTATGVKFIMVSSTPAIVVNASATIVTPAAGIVRYDWGVSDTSTTGNYTAEWEVTWPGPKKQTFPTAAYHTIQIVADLNNA